MADGKIRLIAVLGAAYPQLRDNAPTLDLWTDELLTTGEDPELIEAAIRHAARFANWPTLADLLTSIREVEAERAAAARIAHLPDQVWTEEDDAAATEAMQAAMAEWRSKHPKPSAAPQRPQIPTPGEEYFEGRNVAQRPGGPAQQEDPTIGPLTAGPAQADDGSAPRETPGSTPVQQEGVGTDPGVSPQAD